jgi:hypothetical protein
MQVLEPIGRHALNVRATLQRLQLGDSEVCTRNHVTWTDSGGPATQKANPPRTMFKGAWPLVALTRGSVPLSHSYREHKEENTLLLQFF